MSLDHSTYKPTFEKGMADVCVQEGINEAAVEAIASRIEDVGKLDVGLRRLFALTQNSKILPP